MTAITINPGNNLTSILNGLSSGDVVTINNGTYNLSVVHLPDNITIQGQSRTGVIINISNIAYAIYLQSNSTIKNCTFNCSGTVKVVYVSGVHTDWTIDNCHFINANIAVIAENTSTSMPAACNGQIINNIGTGSKLATLQGQRGVTVSGNKFSNRNGSEFFDFNYNNHYCIVEDNEFVNAAGYSMTQEMIDMVGGNSTTQSYNIVRNNKIVGNFQSGIRPAKSAINNTITGNYIEWKSGATTHEASIYLYGSGTGFNCPKDNQITNNTIVGGTCGIKMSVAQNNTITGNTISDCTRAVALVANSIYGDDLAPQNNTVQNNTFVRVTTCITNEGTNTVTPNTCNSTSPSTGGGIIANATIAWLGDARPSKFGTKGITELTEDLNAALALSPTGRLDAIALVGDFDTGKQTLQAIAASACKNIPIIWVVGNHEIDSGGIVEARTMFGKIPSSMNPLAGPSGTEKTTWSVDVGNMHVVNFNVYWDGGTNDAKGSVSIPSALQSWINSNLAASTKKFKICTCHTPLYPYKRHVNDGGIDSKKTIRDTLQASFVANGVNVFFGAHTHYGTIHQFGGIYHVDAGVCGRKTVDGEDSKASIWYTYTSGNNMILKLIQEPWSSPTTPSWYSGPYTITGSAGGDLPDMTPSELAVYNGQGGQPAYVAVSGIVYNVSSASSWANGNHKNSHAAGQDLTTAFLNKHATSYITSFPPVANLIAEPSPDTIAKWKCSGSPNFQCTRDDTLTGTAGVDYYLSEALCKAACKRTPQPEGTGWDSGVTQAAGVWFKLNLHGLVPVKTLFLNNATNYPTKYPRNFDVQASSDNNNWDEITSVTGNENKDIVIDFPGTLYRYIRISLTAPISDTKSDGTPDDVTETWAIGEMSIYTYHPIISQWTDEESVEEHGLYEAKIEDPALTSKGQTFERAVGEVNARKEPSLRGGDIALKYYFNCTANELVKITVPGTNISKKLIVKKVTYTEGCSGTFNESIQLEEA